MAWGDVDRIYPKGTKVVCQQCGKAVRKLSPRQKWCKPCSDIQRALGYPQRKTKPPIS